MCLHLVGLCILARRIGIRSLQHFGRRWGGRKKYAGCEYGAKQASSGWLDQFVFTVASMIR
eukprot:530009-Pyramimonas_sp.AAC.1